MLTQKSSQREEEGSAGDPSPCLDSLFVEMTKMSTKLLSVTTDYQGDNDRVENNSDSYAGEIVGT